MKNVRFLCLVLLVVACSDQAVDVERSQAGAANAADGAPAWSEPVVASAPSLVGGPLAAPAAAVAQACVNVLIYDDNTLYAHARNAATGLGLPFTRAVSGDFNSLLTSQVWDLVIMDLPSSEPGSGWQTNLVNHVQAGGAAIHTHWNTGTLTPALLAAFEVTTDLVPHQTLTFYGWSGDPLFTTPNVLPGAFDVWNDIQWADNGFRLDATGSARTAAGFTMSPTAGEGAIVIGNNDKTIFNGFLFDDYDPADKDGDLQKDIEALIQNEIVLVCGQPAPVADAGPDQTGANAVEQGTLINLDGSASTDDQGIVSYTWTRLVGGLPVVVSGPNAGPLASILLPLGTHTITLEVADAQGSTDTDAVDIEVIPVAIDPTQGGTAPVVDNGGAVVGKVLIPSGFFGGTTPVPFSAVLLTQGNCTVDALLVGGLCLSVTIPPETVVSGVATVALCFTSATAPPPDYALFRTDAAGTIVLENDDVDLDCSGAGSGSASNEGGNPLTRFARGMWQRVTAPFRPQVLYAYFGHRGAGGLTRSFSDFQWGQQLSVDGAFVSSIRRAGYGELRFEGAYDLSNGPFDPQTDDVRLQFGECSAVCQQLVIPGQEFLDGNGEKFTAIFGRGNRRTTVEIFTDGRLNIHWRGMDLVGLDKSFVPFMFRINDRIEGVGLEFDKNGRCIAANGSLGCMGG